MKICILSGKSGFDVKQIIIGEAQRHFDSVMFAPLSKIRISCRNGNIGSIEPVSDLKDFSDIGDWLLPNKTGFCD